MFIAGFPAGPWGTNCYVVATAPGQECVVVDPGKDAAAGVAEVVREHGLKPVSVLVTHGHIDHMWCVAPVAGTYDATAYVHPDAVVIGDVTLGEEASVWPGAVLRGDLSRDRRRPARVHRCAWDQLPRLPRRVGRGGRLPGEARRLRPRGPAVRGLPEQRRHRRRRGQGQRDPQRRPTEQPARAGHEDADEAQQVLSQVQPWFQEAYIAPRDGPAGEYYRIRIGPFSTKEEAQKNAEKKFPDVLDAPIVWGQV